MSLCPQLLADNGIVLTVCKDIVILVYLAVFILSAFDLFSCASAESNFSIVHWIVDNHSDKMGTPLG